MFRINCRKYRTVFAIDLLPCDTNEFWLSVDLTDGVGDEDPE